MAKTILDIKSGKSLPWAALQLAAYELLDTPVEFDPDGHRYTLNGQPLESVTGILKDEGFIDTSFYTDYGRERGTFVHLACHLDDMGDLDETTLDPVIAPYLEAWRRFKRESGFVVETSEQPMASKLYHYGGTPDRIGHFPSKNLARAVIELHDDATYKPIPYNDRQDRGVWLAALAVHNWKINHGRTV